MTTVSQLRELLRQISILFCLKNYAKTSLELFGTWNLDLTTLKVKLFLIKIILTLGKLHFEIATERRRTFIRIMQVFPFGILICSDI